MNAPGMRWNQSVIMLFVIMGGVFCGARAAQAVNINIRPSSPAVGNWVTFTAAGCEECEEYWWEFRLIGSSMVVDGGEGYLIRKKFSVPGTYWVRVTTNTGDARNVRFSVAANAFTVNVLPSAGCTVTAGDGGVDAAETNGNGIACSGGMAADNPLCTEQFKNSDLAVLKVVPGAGFVFTGWIVNDAEIKTASVDVLFLSAMPVLAGDTVPLPTGKGDCQAHCSKVTITVPNTVKRDEIFDVTLLLDPPPLTSWNQPTVTFDLDGQKTEKLPERGEVQMYDFGYDRDGDGDIEQGQTSYTFNPLLDNGVKTIKAVHNVSLQQVLPYRIKVLASVGGYPFASEPITMTYQVRQYTTAEGNENVNNYDADIQQWVDYWTHWHYPNETNPYTFKMAAGGVEDKLTYDLVKAIGYKESTMKNINIMQCKDPCIAALQSGKEKDWNWSAQPFAVDPEKGNLYNVTDSSPLMKYSGVAVSSSSGSIKWGIRYLYVFKSQASYDFYDGCQNCSGKMYNPQWLNWDDTLNKYNSLSDPNHASYLPDVKGLYENGRNPHKDKKGKRKPPYMWPILTDGSARN